MSFRLVFTERYQRVEARFLKRHPELLGQYARTLQLLEANPHHPALRLHPLKGRLAGLHSVSINLLVPDHPGAFDPGGPDRPRQCWRP